MRRRRPAVRSGQMQLDFGVPVGGLARAFAGHAMIELIEQHDHSPSVYHEDGGPCHYGFPGWLSS